MLYICDNSAMSVYVNTYIAKYEDYYLNIQIFSAKSIKEMSTNQRILFSFLFIWNLHVIYIVRC